MTGDVSDAHEYVPLPSSSLRTQTNPPSNSIISISTASAILTTASSTPQSRRHGSHQGGFWGFLTFTLKLAAVALVCVAGLAGWRAYSKGGKRRGGASAFGGLGGGGGMPRWDNKHF